MRVVAEYRVPEGEWYVRGHFPGRPIVPGVIMVEALAQAAGVAALSVPEHRGKFVLFAGIDDVRFKRIVTPGETLTMECEIHSVRGPIGKSKVVARVDGELAVRGNMIFAATDERMRSRP